MPIKKPVSTLWQVAESIFLGLLLMLMLTAWINSRYSLSVEEVFVKFSSLTRSYIYKSNTESAFNDVWLVNAGSSGQLVPADFGKGDERIADRARLDSFLLLLNQYPNERRVVLCDLSFDKSTAADSSLAIRLSQTPQLFMPAFSSRVPAPFAAISHHVNQGYVDYGKTNQWWLLSDKLNKFRLVKPDGEKSLPLKMFEKTHRQEATGKGPFLQIGSQYYLSTMAVDETVRSFSVHNREVLSAVMPVNIAIDQLKDKDEFTADYVNRSYVIIGNFDTDVHATAFGEVAGALITFNLYKSLENGDNRLPWHWVLMIFIGYTGIIQYALYGKTPKVAEDLKSWINRYFGVIAGTIAIHIPLLLLLSLVSYFIYHISIEVIASATFLGMLFYMRKVLINIQTLRREKAGTSWRHAFFFVLTSKKNITRQ